MGLFSKIKTFFGNKDISLGTYDEGLKKTRGEFVSKLSNLSKKYNITFSD